LDIRLEKLEYQPDHRSVRALIEVVENGKKRLFQGVLVHGADDVVIRMPVHRREAEMLRQLVVHFIEDNGIEAQMRQLLRECAG